MESPSTNESLPMDGWIEASFSKFVVGVTERMRRYELAYILNLALRFIDDLSNWYIRIYRKEIRTGHHSLLSRILREFSIVMGPFTPFFSEYSYQSLSPGESVHFQMYPVYESKTHPFEGAKDIIAAIRYLRETNSISLKTPLKSATILAGNDLHERVREYGDVIKSECNIVDLIYKDEDPSLMSVSVKPNFEGLKKDMSTMKKKMGVIPRMSEEQIKTLMASSLVVDGMEILQSDVLITKKIVCDSGISQAFGDFNVIVDNSMDENIIEMKIAREFHSYIQKLRKNVGLSVGDDVVVKVDCQKLKDIVSKHFAIAFGDLGILCGEGSYEFDGGSYPVTLYKRTTH